MLPCFAVPAILSLCHLLAAQWRDVHPHRHPKMALQPANGSTNSPHLAAFYFSLSLQILWLTATQPADSRPEAKCLPFAAAQLKQDQSVSVELVFSPRDLPEFLNLSTADTLGQISFLPWEAVHCRMFSKIPGLHPSEVRNSLAQ